MQKTNKSMRDFGSSASRREFLQDKLGFELKKIGSGIIDDGLVNGRNIENLIGATQIPLGVAGPMKIDGIKTDIYIPMATTEGALVASTSRGAKATFESGGIKVYIENIGITRGPVFKTKGLEHSLKTEAWIKKNFAQIARACEEDSSFTKLLKIESLKLGQNLYCRMYFYTSEAMGMNMATLATERGAKLIQRQTGAKLMALAGNFDVDKKPSWLNFINGRGRKVWAEVLVKKGVVEEILKTTSEKICELVIAKNYLGSAVSGTMGGNGHFANIVAAIFLATGQDPGHIVEGSLGMTTAKVTNSGDLYFSIYMPSLILGSVGGGTNLPTQREALKILGQGKTLNVERLARIISGAVLCGELSLLSSISEGTLASSHRRLARGKKI